MSATKPSRKKVAVNRVAGSKSEPKPSRPYMPGYVSSDTKGLLAWKWAEDRLKKSREYWIATTRPNGAPHVMVVWGLWWDGALCSALGVSRGRLATWR